MTAQDGMANAGDLTIELDGCAAVVTLRRPRALNALTRAMRDALANAMPGFARDPQVYAVVIRSASERAFCAGSDVREIIALAQADRAEAARAFAEEYRLNWLLECFSKPTISLIDGMVMGGGVGITGFGTHRVAGANYSWAMPETLIGLFPDVGAVFALSRLGAMGQFLGLTGRSIGRADAYRLGLATHCIEASAFDAIQAELALANPVDPVLDGRHGEPGQGDLEAYQDVIERAFSADSVEEILERLGAVQGGQRAWAQEVIADLGRRSPTSLKVTHRHIRDARQADIRQVLETDYRLACGCLEAADFYEGARAALIDKDKTPVWRPALLAEVSPADVARYFGRPAGGDLNLPSREEMQKARV
jgi:enoyl-CoA hydratase